MRKMMAFAIMTAVAINVATASAAVVDFNAGTELASQFNSADFTQVNTSTVGGTGHALRPGGDGQAVYTGQAFAMTNNGDKLVTSVMVYKSGNATGNTFLATVGFGNEAPANGGLFTTAGMNMISLRLLSALGTGDYQLQYQVRAASLGTATNLFQTPLSLANGYYKLTLTTELTDKAAGKFTLSGDVTSYGTDGQTPAANPVRRFDDVIVTNLPLAQSLDELYVGVRSSNGAAGAVRLDNLAADVLVPEPAAAGSMLIVGLAGLLRRRRRASR